MAEARAALFALRLRGFQLPPLREKAKSLELSRAEELRLRRLREEAAAWKRLSTAIAAAMNTTADEV